MRVYSMEKIKELKKLRRRGLSINELVRKLSIPKTTVWYHVHNVKVLPKYIPILKAKRGGSAMRKRKNIKKAEEYAGRLLSDSHRRDFAIIIAMLYWGEGTKKRCAFINSDGAMIRVYLNILRKTFAIPEKSFQITIRIFSGMDKEESLNYWSKITKVPKKKFVVRFNDGGTRGRTRYGMCRVTIRKGGSMLKVMHSLIEKTSGEVSKV